MFLPLIPRFGLPGRCSSRLSYSLGSANIRKVPKISLCEEDRQLELLEAITSRKSIRGYSTAPVPKETIGQILEIASRAPSAYNTQPWEFFVLAGAVLDQLKKALAERFESGAEPHPDFERPTPLVGVYRTRQVELGKSLFQLMDIGREDKEKRNQWTLKMARFWDAPNAIIIGTDREVSGPLLILSIGAITQSIALAALHFGLGTCIEHPPVYYPNVIRQILGIPESKKIVIAMAMGYPDWDFPANRLQSTRELPANTVAWHGF
jgi:nitroreductase